MGKRRNRVMRSEPGFGQRVRGLWLLLCTEPSALKHQEEALIHDGGSKFCCQSAIMTPLFLLVFSFAFFQNARVDSAVLVVELTKHPSSVKSVSSILFSILHLFNHYSRSQNSESVINWPFSYFPPICEACPEYVI